MSDDAVKPEMPTDSPLLRVVHQFESEGFDRQFQALDDGVLRCLSCRAEIPSSSVDGDRLVRLEGVSDPADMLAVLPVECPDCGARGTLVSNYGPEATVEEAALLLAIERTAGGADPAVAPPTS